MPLPANRRREKPAVCLFLFAAVLLSACSSGKPKAVTVGILNPMSALAAGVAGFREGLADLGYVEGTSISYLVPVTEGGPEALESTARDFVKAGVTLILSVTTPASLAAQKATADTGIPVVFLGVNSPIQAGLVRDLAKPGANITGIASGALSSGSSEALLLEWLHMVAPSVTRLYVPYNPDDPSFINPVRVVLETAPRMGFTIIPRYIRSKEEAVEAADSVPADAQGIFLFPDRTIIHAIDRLIAVSRERKIPIAASPLAVRMGALVGYAADISTMGKQAARLADQIFKGIEPADLPVETPEIYRFLNLETARLIGLKVPEQALRLADVLLP